MVDPRSDGAATRSAKGEKVLEAPALAKHDELCYWCRSWEQTEFFRPTRPEDKHLIVECSEGECHIAPPTVHVIHSETITCWPMTAGDDWCASFDDGAGDE